MKTLWIWSAVILAFAACSTATPYQPAAAHGGGYKDLKLDKEKYRISFQGNEETARETVEIYLLYRAAELTVQDGFSFFQVSAPKTDAQTRIDVQPMYAGFGYHRRGGFPYYAYGYSWAPPPTNSETRYEAVAYVAMYKTKPSGDDSMIYDAHEVMKNLEPRIMRPKK